MTHFLSRRQGFKSLTAVGALSVLGLGLNACNNSKNASKLMPDDMTLGESTAKVTIIEYASPTCAHCADFDENVMPALKAKYIDTGKVHYVFREFLTPPADTAAASILLARCAGKDKYFGVLQSVWRSLPEMFPGGQTNNSKAVLENIALSSGMSKDAFNSCIKDTKALEKLQAKMDVYITQHQIDSTPSFIINDKKFAYTGGGIAEFDAALKPLLVAK